jgi:hypothetical protein
MKSRGSCALQKAMDPRLFLGNQNAEAMLRHDAAGIAG